MKGLGDFIMEIKEYYAPAFLGDRMLIHMISDDLQLSSDKKGELIQDYYKNNESKLLKWAKLIKRKCPRFFDDFIEIADLEDVINENHNNGRKGKSKMIVKEEIPFDENAKKNRKLKEAKSNAFLTTQSLIRHYLRQQYPDAVFKTGLDNVAENVYDDFMSYAEDEASGFLINNIMYDDGVLRLGNLRRAIHEFIDFNLRENDIYEYDF